MWTFIGILLSSSLEKTNQFKIDFSDAQDFYKIAKWHWIQVDKQELKIILRLRILFWKILSSIAHCGSINQIILSAINISVAPLELASLHSVIYDSSTEKAPSHKKKLLIASQLGRTLLIMNMESSAKNKVTYQDKRKTFWVVKWLRNEENILTGEQHDMNRKMKATFVFRFILKVRYGVITDLWATIFYY